MVTDSVSALDAPVETVSLAVVPGVAVLFVTWTSSIDGTSFGVVVSVPFGRPSEIWNVDRAGEKARPATSLPLHCRLKKRCPKPIAYSMRPHARSKPQTTYFLGTVS